MFLGNLISNSLAVRYIIDCVLRILHNSPSGRQMGNLDNLTLSLV